MSQRVGDSRTSEIALNQVGMNVASSSLVFQLAFLSPDVCIGIIFSAKNLYLLMFKSINMLVVFHVCVHHMGIANSLSN